MVDHGAVDLYWDDVVGYCAVDGNVGYVAIDLYWGRCGREWGSISLQGTAW